MADTIKDDIKTELNIAAADTSKDSWITLQIRKGSILISNYMNIPAPPVTDPITQPVNISETYPDALIEYVLLRYRKRGNEGIKQFSQGSRSGTYGEDLSDSVKSLLPVQPIRMRG